MLNTELYLDKVHRPPWIFVLAFSSTQTCTRGLFIDVQVRLIPLRVVVFFLKERSNKESESITYR